MPDTVEQNHWDVDRGFVLPPMGDLVSDGRVEHDSDDTEIAYYDTEERDLHAHGMTLTRAAGEDAEWELSLPGDGATVRFAASPAVPGALHTIVAGVTHGRALEHIATIRTVRERYVVSDADGGSRIEIDDEERRASLGDRLLAWREVHTTPAAGQLSKRLRSAGARASIEPSRLTQLLAGDRTVPDTADLAPGAQALGRYVSAQIDRVVLGDIELRRGNDPIHDTRVAIRRLRSTIRVFGPLFSASDPQAVETELKWFAGVLGEVRDCQVQQRRFDAALDELPDELVLGPVRARLAEELRAVELPARAEVTEAMDSQRYLALMTVLRDWRTDPPFEPDAATTAVRKRARKAQRKAQRRLDEALETGDDDQLHRARKAAKRARYAAELTEPLEPKAAERTRKHFKKIQSVLGDHQDTVVAMSWLRRLGVAAGTADGENGFTFGLLYGREQALAAECRHAVQQLR
ncbi:MAG: CHAD domain-containing protein [Actinomycetota bacterium]|nr:CHAD domain-containing protein [Actinomycetota bacterium]